MLKYACRAGLELLYKMASLQKAKLNLLHEGH